MTSRRVARFLVYAGSFACVAGLSKIHASLIAQPAYDFTGSSRFAWAIVYIVVLAVAAYGVGLPDLPRSARQGLVASLSAAALAAVAISVVQLLVGDALLPRFVVFGSAILLIPWYLACVALASDGAAGASDRDRILVVSGRTSVSTLRHELAVSAEHPARVTRVVSVAAVESTGGATSPLVELAERSRATVIVLDREAQSSDSVTAQAAELHQRGLRVRTLSLFYEQWLGKLPVYELERASLLFDISEVHRPRYARLKRLIDAAVAGVGVLVLAPVCLVVLIGNLVGNRGPLFYTQARVGRDGRPFPILKFRTMEAAPEGTDTDWTQRQDPRITPFGALLRRSHLDELPQMVSILRGHLSLVGPRPEQPRYVEALAEKLPFYQLRHIVRPGLTGWAQVKYGYASDEADTLEKLQFDFYYLRNQSLSLDLRILGRTVRHVMGGGGR